jgi:hypothetical protein
MWRYPAVSLNWQNHGPIAACPRQTTWLGLPIRRISYVAPLAGLLPLNMRSSHYPTAAVRGLLQLYPLYPGRLWPAYSHSIQADTVYGRSIRGGYVWYIGAVFWERMLLLYIAAVFKELMFFSWLPYLRRVCLVHSYSIQGGVFYCVAAEFKEGLSCA